ncbi:MAG: porin [Planctomycetota bacterium]
MRILVSSAVALTLASSPSFAGENEWSSLDQEINNLSTSLSAQNPAGPKVGGYIMSSFRYSDDTDALFGGPPNDEDEVGFKLDKVRLEVSGDLGQDYTYKVSFDLASGTASLKDAYVSWQIAESVKATMGQFKKPFLRSGLLADNRLLFYDRSGLGGFFSGREEGLMFTGNFDTIQWWIAGQNGLDGKQDDWNYTLRVVANLMGSGVGKVEGAYGAGEETNLTVGVAYGDEQELDDGAMIGVEAAMTSGPFSLGGELVDFDEGTAGSFPSKSGSDVHYGSSNTFVSVDPADSTPWDLTASYLITEAYEAAIRYEDGDDDDETTAWSIAVNRYIQGHDIKWTLQALSSDSDDPTNEVTEWTLGLTVGI